MTMQFNEIPKSIRRSGRYFEFNTKLAQRGLPENRQSLLLIGQMTSSGNATKETVYPIFDESEGWTYFGRGSILALMISAALKANRYVDLYACGMEDEGAGVAATGTITFANDSTGTATLTLRVGNQKVEILVENDDTPTEIAAALVAAMATTKLPDLPVTAAVNGGDDTQVDLTAKNKGTQGNDIRLKAGWSRDISTTATIVDMASGATDPDPENALDAAKPMQYDFTVLGLNDETNLGDLKTHLDFMQNALEQREGMGMFATRGTLVAATTLAASINSGWMDGPWCEGSPSMPYEIAAAYGSVNAGEEDPAMPRNTLPLVGIGVPDMEDRPTETEIESALWNGITPLEVGPGEIVQIRRSVTTYTENAAGEEDDALLDTTSPLILFYSRKAYRQRIAARFGRSKVVEKTPDKVRSEILDVAKRLEKAEILKKIDKYKDQFIFEVDEDVAGRINADIPTPVVPGLHIFAARINMIL